MTFEEHLQAAIDAAPSSRVAAELIAIRDRLSGASARAAGGGVVTNSGGGGNGGADPDK